MNWFRSLPPTGILCAGALALGCAVTSAQAQDATQNSAAPSQIPAQAAGSAHGSEATTAAMPMPVGSFKSWSSYTFEDKGRLMCYAQSAPSGTIGKVAKRGQAAVMVIQAPDAAAKDQVSIVLGFLPQDGKPVAVKIGRKRKWQTFTLKKFAVGRAWADSESQDRKMVDAMQKADWLVVNATSKQGEKVQDTYNLSGFGKSYDAAVKAYR